MQDIKISTAWVNKLLSGLNVSKAAGPDAIRPVVLKELCQEITPVVALIFINYRYMVCRVSYLGVLSPSLWGEVRLLS